MGFRYIGSKTKILNKVLEHVNRLIKPGSHVVDLMSGTGAVSRALRESGYRVTANDVMTYSFHHCVVLLLLDDEPRFSSVNGTFSESAQAENQNLFAPTEYNQVLMNLNALPGRKGFFWKEFSSAGEPKCGCKPRNYFTPENAAKIDSIRLKIEELKIEKCVDDLEYSVLINDLILAVNDVANIAGTFGHYLSKTVARSYEPIRLTPTAFSQDTSGLHHEVICGYAEDVSEELSCDLCYIDPPYMKRQYAANYHILETLARGDEPEAVGESGLRPWRDQYSNFCTKTHIRDSFRKILRSMKCDHFLVSYSEDGLLGITELESVLAEFGEVEIHEFEYKRFKSNNTKLSPTLSEYVVHLHKS